MRSFIVVGFTAMVIGILIAFTSELDVYHDMVNSRYEDLSLTWEMACEKLVSSLNW